MFTPGAGGRGELRGLCAARHPPHQLGEGEGRPLCSPREQRVSVARDSSKETQGNKCATNRWGGYLGEDAARRAGGQPPPGRLPGAEPLLLAPQPWRGSGVLKGQAEAGLVLLAVGTASSQISLGFCAGLPCWEGAPVCRGLLTAWCPPASPTITDVPQISAFFYQDGGASPAQGCPGSVLCHYLASEPMPAVGIARRLPGDNLPHSLHAPRRAPDSRPAPVFWLLSRFHGFPGNARGQALLWGSLLEPLVLLGSFSLLLWVQAWILVLRCY